MIRDILRRLLLPKTDVAVGEGTYATIPPVPEGEPRPFWSVMIPTRNRPEYLETMLLNLLQQAPPEAEMQIEVIDNCSTVGDIQEIVERVGQGRIGYFRQDHSVPVNENFNTAVRRARGKWVHIPHDDDLVMDDFYRVHQAFIKAHAACSLVISPCVFIDENDIWRRVSRVFADDDGILVNQREMVLKTNQFVMPTVVVKREAYEQVGGYSNTLIAFDWEFWVRSSLNGCNFGQIKRPYYLYRQHSQSDTQVGEYTGSLIKQYLDVSAAVTAQLDDVDERKRWQQLHYKDYNLYCHKHAHANLLQGNFRSALRYTVWAFRFYPSVGNFLGIFRILGIGLRGKLRLLLPAS